MTDLANVILGVKANQRAQESHDLLMKVRQLGLSQAQREDPVLEKELQVRGLKADYDLTEQDFVKSMQGFEQGTRKLLSQGTRTQTEAAVERQPDELGVARTELNTRVADALQHQTATVWNMFKLNKEQGLKMFNRSKLVDPGAEGTDARIDTIDSDEPSGGKLKTPVLSVLGKDGKVIKQYPVAQLEALSQRYGAQYKVVDKNLVRIGADGKVTPLYESDQFMSVPEGATTASRRTGLPPAAGGINTPARPPGSDRDTGRIDQRVKQGADVVNRYMGISDFTGLDTKNQPKYSKIIGLMGQKVRSGMNPELAATSAIEEINHAEAALAAGGRAGGGAAYTGPAPWRATPSR